MSAFRFDLRIDDARCGLTAAETGLLKSLERYCLFCDPTRHDQGELVMLRSDSMYLFAALGAIEEGYMIIAPYDCGSTTSVTALSELTPEAADELLFLRGIVSSYYRDRYGTVGMSFEHGRAGTCLPLRGGTRHCYHAHLCCFPSSYPLWESGRIKNVFDGVAPIVDRYFGLRDSVRNTPYLYIEKSSIEGSLPIDHVARETWDSRIITVEDHVALESQLLRKSFADFAGRPEAWDWLKHPERIRSESLVRDFHAWLRDPRQARLFLIDWVGARPKLDYGCSVMRCNKAGNDYVSPKFYMTWGQRLQQGAIGRFLSRFPDNRSETIRVLDAGCGLGTYANAFAAAGIESYGVDLSSSMLALASRHSASKVRWVQMDVSAPCFPDGSFDGIWLSAVLVHVPRATARTVIRELFKLLKPGGILYISAQIGRGSLFRWEGRVFFYYTEPELRRLFQDAGLELMESWTGEVNEGTCGDHRVKRWRHYLLRSPRIDRLSQDTTTLGALGERAIIAEIRNWLKSGCQNDSILVGAGDDAAVFAVDDGKVVVTTTDHCPTPVLALLGDDDPWVRGWYSMLISLSDLAAMGAKPLGVLLAIEAHRDSSLAELSRFYEGALAASREFDCPIIGGNLREGSALHCVSTAFGQVDRRTILRRDAARSGQSIIVLGDMGVFWAAVLTRLNKLPVPQRYEAAFDAALRRPIPRLAEAAALVSHGLTQCAMDNSDGLVSSFHELAAARPGIDVHIDLGAVTPHPGVAAIAAVADFDVRRLQLAWGDWQLVCACDQSRLPDISAVLSPLGCPINVVGWISDGHGEVWYHDESETMPLRGLPNERFTSGSYFTHDIYEYAALLRRAPLGQRR
jgi:thiamine-monophosphate kinase